MRKKSKPLITNIPAPPPSDSVNDFLKLKNSELCKEVVELKKHREQMFADMNTILKEKLDLEIKHNHVKQVVTEIDKRSRECLRKILDWSGELSSIITLTKGMEKYFDARLNSPRASTNSINKSFKQIVTPHAVNGHIIHSPTIRIARFNDVQDQDSNSNIIEQNFEENGPNEEVQSDNEEDESDEIANTTFESKGRSRSSGVDPEHRLRQLDEHSVIGESNKKSNDEEEEEQTDVEEDNEGEKACERRLSPIEETDAYTSEEEEEDHPVFSEQVKIYLDNLPSTSKVTSKRGKDITIENTTSEINTSLDSSVTVEASTTLNRTNLLNNTSQDERSLTPKRKSFTERKLMGSPIPSDVKRTSFSGCSSNSTLTNNRRSNSSSARNSIRQSLSFEESVSNVSEAPTLKSFIEKTSLLSSTPFNTENRLTSYVKESNTPFLRERVSRRRARAIKNSLVPRVELARMDTSPVFDSKSEHEKDTKGLVLKVELTRMELSDKEIMRLKKSIESNDKIVKSESNKENSVKKKKKTVSREKKPALVEIKRERSPAYSEDSDYGASKRPRRAAMPGTLKELAVNRKMRRE